VPGVAVPAWLRVGFTRGVSLGFIYGAVIGVLMLTHVLGIPEADYFGIFAAPTGSLVGGLWGLFSGLLCGICAGWSDRLGVSHSRLAGAILALEMLVLIVGMGVVGGVDAVVDYFMVTIGPILAGMLSLLVAPLRFQSEEEGEFKG